MRSIHRAICAVIALSTAASAQTMFPFDTAVAFRRHTLARIHGSRYEVVTALKAGNNGEIYIAGNTTSSDLPVRNAAQAQSPEGVAMRSLDGGKTWSRFNPPPVSANGSMAEVRLLRAHPSIPGLLFAAVGPTLWRSSDFGQSWQKSYAVQTIDNSISVAVSSIGFDALMPATIYLYSPDGFTISEDGGVSWRAPVKPSPDSFVGPSISESRIESDPRGSGALMLTGGSSPLLSRDRGKTWTAIRSPATTTSLTATFGASHDGRIYAGLGIGVYGSLWMSDDWGATWTPTMAQPSTAIVDLFTDPQFPQRLYVLTLGSLLVSEDEGQTLKGPERSIYVGYTVSQGTHCDSGALLVATQGRHELAFSYDVGKTWNRSPVSDVQRFTAGSNCSVYALKDVSGDAFVGRVDQTGAVEWLTYLADVGVEAATALSIDGSGNVLVAGTTGAVTTDILLAKYSSDGRLLWKKTFGSEDRDTPWDIAADASGNIVVAGLTNSANFPVTAGAIRSQQGGGFAAKLSPSGDMVWAMYLESARSLAIEPDNSILIADSESLVRIHPTATMLERVSTMVKHPALVRTDSSGNVYLAGTTDSSEQETATPGAYVSPVRARPCPAVAFSGPVMSQTDIQVARLKAGNLQPEFSALLGGECGSRPDSLDISSDGKVTVGFVTQSEAFDLRSPLASAGFCTIYDLATGVAQLSSNGAELLRSTLLDGCNAVRVASAGSTVYTASDNNDEGFIVRADATPVTDAPRLDNVSNAFSGTGFGVTHGELVSLSGVGLGPATAVDLGILPQVALPRELSGTEVLFNGTPVPLLRASADQIIFAAPYQITGRSATIQVRRNGQGSNEILVPVVPAVPALLAAGFPFTDPESAPPANARNADGKLNTPANPAVAGSTVWVFATGLGAANSLVRSGETATSEMLQPTTTFREEGEVPFSVIPGMPPTPPSRARAMPGFLNSIFAIPVTAKDSPDDPGRQTLRITASPVLRGTARRNFSPAVTIYVCQPGSTGTCETR